jgi:hypothetical protein
MLSDRFTVSMLVRHGNPHHGSAQHRWLRVRVLGARPGGSEGIQTCQPFLHRSGLN